MIFIDLSVFIDKIKFKIFKLENNERHYLSEDEIIIPVSFSIGEKLNYIRKNIKTLIEFYHIELAYMNIDEKMNIDVIDIVKIEGVMQELLSNYGVRICI